MKENKNNGDAISWAHDMYAQAAVWNKRLLYLTIGSFIVSIFLVVALFMLLPLKEQIPIFIRVDNATGNIDVISTLEEYTVTADQALDEAFLVRYIRNREGYLYQKFENNYEVVMALSDYKIGNAYHKIITDNENPKNPFFKYSDKAEVTVKINNISHIKPRLAGQEGVSVIRFTIKELYQGKQPVSISKIATITYEYTPSELERSRRWINPLGFVITNYILEDEFK